MYIGDRCAWWTYIIMYADTTTHEYERSYLLRQYTFPEQTANGVRPQPTNQPTKQTSIDMKNELLPAMSQWKYGSTYENNMNK